MTARGITPSTPAWLALAEALDTTPSLCKGMPEWTSEDVEDRQVAARACRSCPVLQLCQVAAESTGEDFGVWAGVDRTTTKTPKRARTA